MTHQEIKDKIEYNNQLISDSLTPNMFTLNSVVASLLEENRKLQQECDHEYEDGWCKWCYKSEGDN